MLVVLLHWLGCLLVDFRMAAQQPGGDTQHGTHTTYNIELTGVSYGLGVE
jgi:hypothetical protein